MGVAGTKNGLKQRFKIFISIDLIHMIYENDGQTHSCCNKRLKMEGGKATCCICTTCQYCKRTDGHVEDFSEAELIAFDKLVGVRTTCLNIECPERKGGECTAEEKVKDWFEEYDWRKEFDVKFSGCFNFVAEEHFPDIKQFIETLLIKILAKCESCATAKDCRHEIKNYLLK